MFSSLANKLKEKVSDEIEEKIKDKVADLILGEEDNKDEDVEAAAKRALEKQPPASDCKGNKRAVFIGINYRGQQGELRGCINDVNNIASFISGKWGFDKSNFMILTDDESEKPTKRNIERAMDWLVEGAKAGDSLFWHYSGHGSRQKDDNGDEADGMDEVLVPLDHQEAGMITDDVIHEKLVQPLPEGVRLTILMDCCHSGSIVDLPFTYKCTGDLELQVRDESMKRVILKAAMDAGMRAFRGDGGAGGIIGALTEGLKVVARKKMGGGDGGGANAEKQKQLEETNTSRADVFMFSGCRDDQTSADAVIDNQATGAMSHCLVKSFKALQEEGSDAPNYTDVLKRMREELTKGKYSQVPQMSCGRLLDMKHEFLM